MKNLTRPKAVIAAHFDGINRANDWLDRPENLAPCASSEEYRAHCHAIAARKYESQSQSKSPALLAEWEYGFDSTLKAAEEYYLAASSGLPVSSRADIIQRGQTNVAAALLAAIELLPVADQQGILVTCSSIVSAVARDLDALVRGAA